MNKQIYYNGRPAGDWGFFSLNPFSVTPNPSFSYVALTVHRYGFDRRIDVP